MEKLELIDPAALDVANRIEFARQEIRALYDAEKALVADLRRALDAVYADLTEEVQR